MSEWQNIAGANTYFETRAGATAWAGYTDAVKQSDLTTAFNRLNDHEDYDLPSAPTGSALEKIQRAQCEMAWYIHKHIEDEDERKGLQAQGVIKAGIVKEEYNITDLHTLPLPPVVVNLLKDYCNVEAVYQIDIGRDENFEADSTSPVDDQELET